MLIDFLRHEHAAFAQERDDVGVRIENILARELRQPGLLGKTAVIVHGRENRQAALFP